MIVKKMKKNLFLFLVFLFLLVNTSKADNLAPESIKGARTVVRQQPNYY